MMFFLILGAAFTPTPVSVRQQGSFDRLFFGVHPTGEHQRTNKDDVCRRAKALCAAQLV
jgi:hypothetical protein